MHKFDLEERTLAFSKDIIIFCRKLPLNRENNPLIQQLVRSATSVGANYREANETDSKKDFKNRIRISKKEAKETIYWLQLILELNYEFKEKIILFIDEAKQLMKILASIYDKVV